MYYRSISRRVWRERWIVFADDRDAHACDRMTAITPSPPKNTESRRGPTAGTVAWYAQHRRVLVGFQFLGIQSPVLSPSFSNGSQYIKGIAPRNKYEGTATVGRQQSATKNLRASRQMATAGLLHKTSPSTSSLPTSFSPRAARLQTGTSSEADSRQVCLPTRNQTE